MSRSKQKGTAYESLLVAYLKERGIDARRIVLHGNKDQGDIDAGTWNLEAKDCRTFSLAEWCDESDVESLNSGKPVAVVFKRARKNVSKSYVLIPLERYVDEVLL